MPPLVLSALLFGLHWPGSSAHAERIQGWMLKVGTDAFTGVRHCQLKRRNVEVRRSALILHGPKALETGQALYRIDAGPAIDVASDHMALAAQGFLLEGENVANPSEGLVRIPLSRLSNPGRILVQARPGHELLRFEVAGLDAALLAAGKAGCTPTSLQ